MKPLSILALGVALCLAAAAPAHAQWTPDTAHTGAGYANDVYYSLPNGTVSTQPRANWHIGLGTATGSSLIVNHAGDVNVYRTSFDTTQWAAMNATGQMTDELEIFNNEADWEMGAFNTTPDPNDPFDIGWAIYSMTGAGAYPPHSIIGDSLYYVMAEGVAYRLWVRYRIPGGIYSLTYMPDAGGAETTLTFDLDDYADASTTPARKKNFIYINFTTGQIVDREPYNDSWDLLFTRYLAAQPNGTLYPVSGVKTNLGTEVAEFMSIDVNTLTDTTGAAWTLDATTIGSDWKAFDGQQFVITDSLAWAVQAHDGNVWVLYFDYFPGSASGAYGLQKRLLEVVGAPEAPEALRLGVYPNPASTVLNVVMDTPAPAPATLTLRDMSGRAVFSTRVLLPGGLSPVALTGLDMPSGIYALTAETNGTVATQRVIISR